MIKANSMKQIILAVAVVMSVMLFGCEDKKTEEPDSRGDELILYCAAGIRSPVVEMLEIFASEHGVRIIPDYAGSEVLLSKIKVSRRGDLYMPGDRYYIEQAASEDMLLSSRTLCYWIPTILVRKGNPKNISSLEDLLKPGLKLGLGDPNACAIGRTTCLILAKNGITRKDIEQNLIYQSLTVNELGMQISAKALDVVIVWDAMARYYAKSGDQVPIPPEKNVISTVDVGVLKFTKNRELAEKFVAFLTSEHGREIFTKYGYQTKPPE